MNEQQLATRLRWMAQDLKTIVKISARTSDEEEHNKYLKLLTDIKMVIEKLEE